MTKNLTELLPKGIRPRSPQAESVLHEGYTRLDLPEGLAKQLAEYVASTGKAPGIHRRRNRDGKVIRTTAGWDVRGKALASGAEVSATVKLPVEEA